MRPKWVMHAWAGVPSCGLAPVDVGHVLQESVYRNGSEPFFFGASHLFFSHSTTQR